MKTDSFTRGYLQGIMGYLEPNWMSQDIDFVLGVTFGLSDYIVLCSQRETVPASLS